MGNLKDQENVDQENKEVEWDTVTIKKRNPENQNKLEVKDADANQKNQKSLKNLKNVDQEDVNHTEEVANVVENLNKQEVKDVDANLKNLKSLKNLNVVVL